MEILRRACRRLVGMLSWRRRNGCKDTAATLTSADGSLTCAAVQELATSSPGQQEDEAERVRSSGAILELSASYEESFEHLELPAVVLTVDPECDGVVPLPNAPSYDGSHHVQSTLSRVSLLQPLPVTRTPSSESDSGVCLDGEEAEIAEDEEDEEEEIDDEEEEKEEEEEEGEGEDWPWECSCDECFFARCEEELEDWRISAKNLSLDKIVSRESGEIVYSGYWHGSVTVHQRHTPDKPQLHCCMEEALTLSKIRHENIQLFLGVCMDLQSDSVTLIMSDLKGESLHTRLHRGNQEFTFPAMTKVISQIAQGMAYLHDRGIAHPLLSSKSISFHYRACITMLSPSSTDCVDGSHLVYLPPEVIRTLTPPPSSHHSTGNTGCKPFLTCPPIQEILPANVFSFGTIIYELMNMSLPFHKTPGELIIWQVGNCHTQSLTHLHDGKLKEIVTQCWLPASVQRPSFKELLGTLEQNMSPRACGLKAYFSFSEPSQLAKTGLW